ncbi:FAD-dependent oxidoreductase [Thiogranum longum]
MSAVLQEDLTGSEAEACEPIVVVGTGPVGIKVVEELLQRDATTPIVIFGNEPWEPYNRVRLSSLLTGELNLSGIQNPLRLPERHQVVQHHNCEVVSIDRANQLVIDQSGKSQRYSRLVLATGSSPRIPHIEGITEKKGIYTFRNLDDAQQLIARRARCRRAVVLGGGLLGLEAARGLQKHGTEVVVIEHSNRLMAQQLDPAAAELLHEHLSTLNIRVMLESSVKRVLGDTEITGLLLRSGRQVECDTLVIATGIQANLGLARDAGLSVGRGIRVNDRMQTSDPCIYAVGECSEHRDRVYGLVAPGLEQAGVAAHCIHGGKSSYLGSQSATRLKVVGVPVFSMGPTGEHEISSSVKTLSFRSYNSDVYRRLLIKRGRLVGAIAYGDWPEISRVQETIRRSRYVWPAQVRRFMKTGLLWPEQEAENVADWPASTVVCQCTGVKRGALTQAVGAGHHSVEALCAATGASSVCGSCKPLLAELVGRPELEPEKGSRTLIGTGIISLLAALALLVAPAIPFPDSVQTSLRWDLLWRESLLKQITGFSLLGIGALISSISLRKRIPRFSFGTFGSWRVVHVALGALGIATLIAHTGLRLGHNLNLLLMLSFVGLLLVGSVASAVIGMQHRLPRVAAKRTRELSLWMHILLLWPLPALLAFHILKTYWY